MKPAMKRVLMTRIVDNQRREKETRPEYRNDEHDPYYREPRYEHDYPRMGGYEPVEYNGWRRHIPPYSEYGEPDMRRRRSDGTYMGMGDYIDNHHRPYVQPIYEEKREREERRPMSKIGFSVDGEMERIPEIRHEYPNDASYAPVSEMANRTGQRMKGHAEGKGTTPMTKEKAMAWAEMLENEDGTFGPHWTMEQTKQVMAQKKLQCDPVEFFLALNLTYSDLCNVFRKHGINNMDAYVDFAKAFWLEDRDISGDKLSKYYEMVVM